MNSKLEFVVCRRCKKEYAKWSNPFCRYCWKKYYKGRSYIPREEELLTFTTYQKPNAQIPNNQS